MRVSFYTLGCKVNIYESESLAAELQQHGYDVVAWPGEADIYVINGCAVTARAAAKSRQVANRVRRLHPQARLVQMGCYVTAEPDEAQGIGADLVLDNTRKPRLRFYLQHMLENSDSAMPLPHEEHAGFAEYAGFAPLQHSRPFIKIQDGCNNRCSFCLIPDLRGPERSRAMDAILQEAQRYTDLGYRELILTGIHLSRWGSDMQPPLRLVDLLRALLKDKDCPRVRLSSTEPTDIDDELIDFYVAHASRLCLHLHIPLQSGSDATLQRMGRRYRTDEYRNLLQKLRALLPGISVSTDVIVGFPGETAQEFDQTYAFCQEMNFSRMHIFRYSKRAGTPAADMPMQVEPQVQEERSAKLHALAETMARAYAATFLGEEVEVLLEQKPAEQEMASGYSSHYLQGNISWSKEIPATGMIHRFIVQRVEGDRLYAAKEDKE